MKRLMPALILLLTLPSSLVVQEQTTPLPDRWRGLIVDQSTPEDAIRVLGRPSSDKVTSLTVYHINAWVTRRRKEKIFRRLEFKKPEGIDKAILCFLDNKLVMIELDLKSGISPNGLANIYGVSFRPMVSEVSEGLNPRDFERDQGRVYPRVYPVTYYMVAVSPQSFISAMVGNVPSFGGALARTMGIPDREGSFPGKVEILQIISRTLENRDGADQLR